MRIGIIGAGHVGVEAARTAAAAGAEVTLFSAETALPYYKPQLVAVAFGQIAEDAIHMHPRGWYEAQGIKLLIDSPVERVDALAGAAVTRGARFDFDALVLATGASPAVPPFARDADGGALPLWTLDHARQIRNHIRAGAHVVIVGGGIIGVEAAFRAADVGVSVEIVERTDRLMSTDLGANASAALQRRLQEKGVGLHLGQTVMRIAGTDGPAATVELQSGVALPADLVIVAVGVSRDLSLAREAGLNTDRGISVARTLRTSAGNIFACGDIAEIGNMTQCSTLEAVAQGRLASTNALELLSGHDPKEYADIEVPLSFKYGGFEMHTIGQKADKDSEERVLDGSDELNYRALIVKNGATVGVEMVGDGRDFSKYARKFGRH